MTPLKIGLCGLGTVGTATVELLQRQSTLLTQRAGRPLALSAVASRTAKPEVPLGGAPFSTDPLALARDPTLDVIVETIGGETVARQVIETALAAGKSVVTANKAVVAAYGDHLHAQVQPGRTLAYEAAVAGGIPIIHALQCGLSANRIDWLAGIINGTCNYILTAMAEEGASFDDALAKAQALGYAEADPTFDVDGIDAAHKLAILAALAFDMPFAFDAAHVEGIRGIEAEDIGYARALGYRIKHLGLARRAGEGVELRVHPTLVPESHGLARVDDVMNAVAVHGDTVGTTVYQGPGAGGNATASAIVADLVQVAREQSPAMVVARNTTASKSVVPIDAVASAHYLRIPLSDQPGEMARVTNTLSASGISIEALIQREEAVATAAAKPWVPVVIITDRVEDHRVREALAALGRLDGVVGSIVRLRVESLAG